MPHITVKLWPGKSEQQKRRLAEALTRDVMEVLGVGEDSVSVSILEVPAEAWKDHVYRTDIMGDPAKLYKRPGYGY